MNDEYKDSDITRINPERIEMPAACEGEVYTYAAELPVVFEKPCDEAENDRAESIGFGTEVEDAEASDAQESVCRTVYPTSSLEPEPTPPPKGKLSSDPFSIYGDASPLNRYAKKKEDDGTDESKEGADSPLETVSDGASAEIPTEGASDEDVSVEATEEATVSDDVSAEVPEEGAPSDGTPVFGLDIEVPIEADFRSEVADVREETAPELGILAGDIDNDDADDGIDSYLTDYTLSENTAGAYGNGNTPIDYGAWDIPHEDTEYSDDEAVAEAIPLPDDDTHIIATLPASFLTDTSDNVDKASVDIEGASSIKSVESVAFEAHNGFSDGESISVKEDASLPVIDRSDIVKGTVVARCYTVVEKLQVTAGESDLYLCEYSGKSFVLKLYKRADAVKPQIRTVLASINSPYVASPVAIGEIGGLPYEIIPYYKNGSLKGRKYTFEQMRELVVPELNEMLRVIHSYGIIHKDIKPSNIMLRDDGKSFALIDFGISSIVKVGKDEDGAVFDDIGLTPIYSAPEVKSSHLAYTLSDYYSLGITLYELYAGEPPLLSRSGEERDRYLSENQIPIPDYFPEELAELILGLTYRDLSNRCDADNPDNRWGYKQALAWCLGKRQTVPGKAEAFPAESDYDIGGFVFCGLCFEKSSELARALGENWESALECLGGGELERHLKVANPGLSRLCEEIVERTDNHDVALWHIINAFAASSRTAFYWRGRSFSSAVAFGESLLSELCDGREVDLEYWGSILDKRLLSAYCAKHKASVGGGSIRSTSANAEIMWKGADYGTKLRCLYTAAFIFCGKAELVLPSGERFTDVSELRGYMKDLYERSLTELRAFVDYLILGGNELLPQFEAWLAFYGHDRAVSKWKKRR